MYSIARSKGIYLKYLNTNTHGATHGFKFFSIYGGVKAIFEKMTEGPVPTSDLTLTLLLARRGA